MGDARNRSAVISHGAGRTRMTVLEPIVGLLGREINFTGRDAVWRAVLTRGHRSDHRNRGVHKLLDGGKD